MIRTNKQLFCVPIYSPPADRIVLLTYLLLVDHLSGVHCSVLCPAWSGVECGETVGGQESEQ